jgi:ketosteroid isomerase-like protein
MEYMPGYLYEADFRNGQRHEQDCGVVSPRGTYTGDWVDDKKQGQDRFVGADGNVYEGSFHAVLSTRGGGA